MKCILFMVFVISIAVSGCSQPNDPDYDSDHNIMQNAGIKEAVTLANEWHFSKPDIVSFINSDEMVVVLPDGRKLTKSLPEDEMLVAIAPYVNSTHECAVHYFSSCTGEMKTKKFRVNVSDANGNIILNDQITSLKNGFFELWLPRGGSYNMTVKFNDLQADELIRTHDGSNTCITSLQLK